MFLLMFEKIQRNNKQKEGSFRGKFRTQYNIYDGVFSEKN